MSEPPNPAATPRGTSGHCGQASVVRIGFPYYYLIAQFSVLSTLPITCGVVSPN